MQKSFYLLLIIAHVLLAISFQSNFPFWTVFPLSFLVLTIAATILGTYDWKKSSALTILLGIFSGLFMYALFFIGKIISGYIFPDQLTEVVKLYSKIKPVTSWNFILLFLIIIPGEELFWRGFIQKKLSHVLHNKNWLIIVSALLYTSANIYTGSPLFLLATFMGGIVWGALYLWKQNIGIVILSHLVFNLFLLVLFPIF
ncbi:CPBP family intramembrane glutamic endopeptidase [Fredinandcohnia sp. 179-A 10B2 NHS]|uniref:CPBP family intramembrane glutamic endopeptidase n=1 Tax=Fredinandcohnia sp. 179-A 10B2 NHS TaxID=3235176 RepID=UPI0039A18CA5